MATQLNARMLLYLSIGLAGTMIKAACDNTPIRYNLPPSPPLLACDLERTQSTPIATLSGRFCESPSPVRLCESPAPSDQHDSHHPPLYKSLSIISINNHAGETPVASNILDRLTVVYGPMWAGKGEYLLNKATELSKAPDNPLIVAFIHGFIGERQGAIIFSRATTVTPCEAKVVLTAAKLYTKMKKIACSTAQTKRIELIADESQFFAKQESPNLTKVITKLHHKYQNMYFTVGGLDTSFTGEGFGCMPDLIQRAGTKVPLFAFCQICQVLQGKDEQESIATRIQRLKEAGEKPKATRNQRLVDGLPARASDPLVIPEGSNKKVTYEPRCETPCFQAPV